MKKNIIKPAVFVPKNLSSEFNLNWEQCGRAATRWKDPDYSLLEGFNFIWMCSWRWYLSGCCYHFIVKLDPFCSAIRIIIVVKPSKTRPSNLRRASPLRHIHNNFPWRNPSSPNNIKTVDLLSGFQLQSTSPLCVQISTVLTNCLSEFDSVGWWEEILRKKELQSSTRCTTANCGGLNNTSVTGLIEERRSTLSLHPHPRQ